MKAFYNAFGQIFFKISAKNQKKFAFLGGQKNYEPYSTLAAMVISEVDPIFRFPLPYSIFESYRRWEVFRYSLIISV